MHANEKAVVHQRIGFEELQVVPEDSEEPATGLRGHDPAAVDVVVFEDAPCQVRLRGLLQTQVLARLGGAALEVVDLVDGEGRRGVDHVVADEEVQRARGGGEAVQPHEADEHRGGVLDEVLVVPLEDRQQRLHLVLGQRLDQELVAHRSDEQRAAATCSQLGLEARQRDLPRAAVRLFGDAQSLADVREDVGRVVFHLHFGRSLPHPHHSPHGHRQRDRHAEPPELAVVPHFLWQWVCSEAKEGRQPRSFHFDVGIWF